MRRLISIIVVVVVILAGLFAYGLVTTAIQETVEENPLSSFIPRIPISSYVTPVVLPDPITIVKEVNQLARLETASIEIEKVITAEQNADAWLGLFEDSMVFVAYGEVIAGIDLQKIEEGDIQVMDPTTVMVHLPDAEIFVATLDNQRSYVADRDTGLFTGADPELETEVRQQAELVVRNEAIEYGIVLEAEENAQEYMQNFLHGLGFETIIFTPDKPPTPPPFEQEIPKGKVLATPAP